MKKKLKELKPSGGDRKKCEESLILKSKILFTTLSTAGQDRLEILNDHIDFLIIDEACQSTETSCLIPFRLRPKHVILVGD